MKLYKVLSIVILVAMVLAACGQSGSEEEAAAEPLKLGLLAPLSGSVPTFGQSTKEGAELAVKEWNAKGGVLGRQIELIVEDSQCEADPAVNAANKLIDQDGVKYHRR